MLFLCQGPQSHPSHLPLPSSLAMAERVQWLGEAFCQPEGQSSNPQPPPTTAEAGPLPDTGLFCLATLQGPKRGLAGVYGPNMGRSQAPGSGSNKRVNSLLSRTWSLTRRALTEPCAPPSMLSPP